MKYLGLTLLTLAFATSQLLIGGARLLYCLPAYGLLALVAFCAFWPRWRPGSALPLGSLFTSLLFFGYVIVQSQFAPVEYFARNDLFIVLGGLMVYLLTAVFFVRAEERRFLLYGLLGLAAAHVVLGAIQFRDGHQFMPFAWMQRSDKFWRASGFYISPNHFAGLLEIVGLLAFSMAIWSKRRVVEKVIMAYLGVCCAIGIGISGSRGGYLALMAGVACLIILSLWTCRFFYRGRWALISVATLAVAVLVAASAATLMFQSDTLRKRFFDIHEPGNMRFFLWDAALVQFRLEPVWGTGSGTFISYGRTFRDPRVQNDPVFVHNDYLHLLAEYGMAGAAGFLIFFAWHAGSALRAIGKLARKLNEIGETRGDALALHLGAMSVIGAYVVHSAVDFNLHIPANALAMAMVFGIIANPGLIKASPKWGQRAGSIGTRAALFGIAVFVLVYGMPLIRGEWYAEKTRRALINYQLEEARELAVEALKFEQSNPEIYFYAGEAAREMAANKMGDVDELQEEAIRMFKRGLEVFPDDSRTMVKLAEAYDQAKRFDEAEEILTRAYEIDPNSLYVHAYYGMHYRDQGLIVEAANEFQIARELDLDNSYKIVKFGFEEIQKVLADYETAHPPAAANPAAETEPADPPEPPEPEDPPEPSTPPEPPEPPEPDK